MMPFLGGTKKEISELITNVLKTASGQKKDFAINRFNICRGRRNSALYQATTMQYISASEGNLTVPRSLKISSSTSKCPPQTGLNHQNEWEGKSRLKSGKVKGIERDRGKFSWKRYEQHFIKYQNLNQKVPLFESDSPEKEQGGCWPLLQIHSRYCLDGETELR